MARCAKCLVDLRHADCTGESALFSPDREFELCEPCWIKEDALIDERGTNDLPEIVERYRDNLRGAR